MSDYRRGKSFLRPSFRRRKIGRWTDRGGLGVASKQALRFVHLRVHSAYSLLEGALQVPKVIDLAVANKAPAIAITDTNNLFGALEFAQKGSKAGLQPIIGCQLDIAFHDQAEESRSANGAKRWAWRRSCFLLQRRRICQSRAPCQPAHIWKRPAGDPVQHYIGLAAGSVRRASSSCRAGRKVAIAKAIKDDRIDRARQRLN